MDGIARRFFLTAFIAVAGGSLFAAYGPALAQSNAPAARHGAPQDWSHKHLLHTNPDSRDEAARKGTLAFEKWKQNNKDPRFALQVARKTRFTQAAEHSPFSPQQLQWADRHGRDTAPAGPAIERDWSKPLGAAAGAGKTGVFPATFGFAMDEEASCADDFVVFTTAAAGATGTAAAFARQTGSFSGNPKNGQTVTITNGSDSITLSASTHSNTDNHFQRSGDTATLAANLASAIARNGAAAGVTATSAGDVVSVEALVAGSGGNSIVLAEGLDHFDWSGTHLAGGSAGAAGQATIVAFNNMYKTTCAGQVPATFWSYNTGTGAVTETSPVISEDGKQVAFVQRTAANVANLVLLKWDGDAKGRVAAPSAPSPATAAAYRGCSAPCMHVIAFSGNANNTNSSPYYDYASDILYVGADNGTLHKFTGVFNGAPAELTTAGWPVSVSAGNMLSSPVYDSDSGLVFVGSDTGAASGGRLHSVNASGGVASSGQLAAYTIDVAGANTTGVRDAPIVDSSAQRVYAFVESDTSLVLGQQGCGVPGNFAECKAVYQFSTSVPLAGQTPAKVNIGRGQVGARILYSGIFDDAYYNTGTGNLYVCGSASGSIHSTYPTLWRIPISGSGMGTPVAGPTLVSGSADCSPITEVMNGTSDRLYVGVSALGNKPGCSGACIYMFNLTGLAWGPASNPGAGLAAPGGTSGIVIGNISNTTGATQIYYSTLGNGTIGNAVQASQPGLQ